MTALFMVTFVVAVCVAEAVKVNNDMNVEMKQNRKDFCKESIAKTDWM